MLFYFFNFLFSILQAEPQEEVIQTYQALHTVAWVLIGCTLFIFFLFGYLFYAQRKKKRSNQDT